MPTYDVECQSCGEIKEVNCPYTERNNTFPCGKCGGDSKKIVSGFSLGAGMYHEKTPSISRKNDLISELKACGIERISASSQGLEDTCKDLLKNKSQVTDQMKAGEERQKKILAEKVKASTPSASEVRRLEKIYEKKSKKKT